MDSFIVIALIIALLAFTLLYTVLMLSSPRRQPQPKPRIVSRIVCVSGDYEEVRDFSEGDYVGKEVGRCPKCGKALVVDAIYSE